MSKMKSNTHSVREPIRVCGVRDRLYFLNVYINISASNKKADTHLA